MEKSFKRFKQQVLIDFHLRDIESFRQNISIFDKNQINEVMAFIVNQKRQEKETKRLYFIIILVPLKHEFYLRNIVIKEETDVNHICERLSREESYSEIWVCTNRADARENYSGRFCIEQLNGVENHILEIVENDIPRSVEKIESHFEKKYEKEMNDYNYVRNRWSTRFKQSGDQYGSNGMNKVTIQICQEIERKREQIDFLFNCLTNIGIKNFSLDFRFQNGKLEFIDWDTENDKDVIAHFGSV